MREINLAGTWASQHRQNTSRRTLPFLSWNKTVAACRPWHASHYKTSNTAYCSSCTADGTDCHVHTVHILQRTQCQSLHLTCYTYLQGHGVAGLGASSAPAQQSHAMGAAAGSARVAVTSPDAATRNTVPEYLQEHLFPVRLNRS